MKKKIFMLGMVTMFGVITTLGCVGTNTTENIPTEIVIESTQETESEQETKKEYTEEELLEIDGGDAEYWKHYDAEGNPIDHDKYDLEYESKYGGESEETESAQETEEHTDLSNHSLYPYYKSVMNSIDTVKIIDTEDLTEEMLLNRSKDGTIIIERSIGIVIDSDLNGEIINTDDEFYINYQSVEGVKEGDIILSYFIYNPDTSYTDDILDRFDYIIDSTLD